jgi:hypothetical protein
MAVQLKIERETGKGRLGIDWEEDWEFIWGKAAAFCERQEGYVNC